MRVRVLPVIACVGVWLVAACTTTNTGTSVSQIPASAARLNQAQAWSQFEAVVARAEFFPCAPEDITPHPLTRRSLEGGALAIECNNGKRRTIVMADNARAFQHAGFSNRLVCFSAQETACFDRSSVSDTAVGFFVRDREDVQLIVDAWSALARPVVLSPAQDAAFQAALARARATGGDRSEAQRRAQLQVEALVESRREAEAAGVYRAALTEMPDWALGHYNLALIAASLSRYDEAVAEMQRYLYVEPNAPDARAAQDQIYRWEALLNTGRQ